MLTANVSNVIGFSTQRPRAPKVETGATSQSHIFDFFERFDLNNNNKKINISSTDSHA